MTAVALHRYQPPRRHPCHSSVSTYEACPAAFKVGYIDEDPGLGADNLNRGKQAHEVMARYAAHCYQAKRKSDLEEGRAILAGYPDEVQALLENFLDNWRWEFGSVVFKGAAPVEQHLKARLPGGMEFTGHLDLLQKYDDAATAQAIEQEGVFGADDEPDLGDGALWVVTDFASRWYDKGKQLARYAWLVQQNWPGARVIETRVQPFAGGYIGDPVRFEGDLDYIGYELQALCDRIAADEDYEANPGAACLMCNYTLACPCRDSATLKQILGDTPEDRLRRKLFYDAQAAAETELLKAHAQKNGPVRVEGYVYEGRAASSLVPHKEGTLDVDLQQFGLTRNDLTAGITKAAIEKAAKKLDDGPRQAFMDLFDLKVGSVMYKAYKANGNGDEPD